MVVRCTRLSLFTPKGNSFGISSVREWMYPRDTELEKNWLTWYSSNDFVVPRLRTAPLIVMWDFVLLWHENKHLYFVTVTCITTCHTADAMWHEILVCCNRRYSEYFLAVTNIDTNWALVFPPEGVRWYAGYMTISLHAYSHSSFISHIYPTVL